MRESDARSFISANSSPARHLVVQAKAYLMKHPRWDTKEMITGFIESMGVITVPPKEVNLDDDAGCEATLRAYCEHMRCRTAAIEALWTLLNQGVFFPLSNDPATNFEANLAWRNSRGGGGLGPFDYLRASAPRQVQQTSILRADSGQVLSDGDLYVNDLGISDVHPLVLESLREAVRCYRLDLYVPCLAMLARAVEGAWTELGIALLDALPEGEQANVEKARRDLGNPQHALSRRVQDVCKQYARQQFFQPLWKTTRLTADDLRDTAALWTDQVRDSRNVLHHEYKPATANTLEKVGILLMAAVPRLRDLYKIRDAAQAMATPRARP
jgi:hypothetical protein